MKIKVLTIAEGEILISQLQTKGVNVSSEVEQDEQGLLWVKTYEAETISEPSCYLYSKYGLSLPNR